MTWEIRQGDALELLRAMPAGSVQCCVTSPPYWGLRDYGTATWKGGDAECDHMERTAGECHAKSTLGLGPNRDGLKPTNAAFKALEKQYRDACGKCGARRIDQQVGLESTPEQYVARLVEVFREVRRVLREDGTLWCNLGDSYSATTKGSGGQNSTTVGNGRGQSTNAGSFHAERSWSIPPGLKPKDLVGIPWRVAFALQADGWWLRSDIIWCLSGGTKVYARTHRGDAPATLKDLARLDPATVKLWNGSRWTQVLGWSQTARAVQYEIELRSGERIGCTAHHEWPTQRGIVRAADLAVGDVLAVRALPEPADGADAPSHIPDEIGWLVGLYLAEGSRSGETVQIAGDVREDARHRRLAEIARAFGATLRVHRTGGQSCTANLDGAGLLIAIIERYVGGRVASDKHLKPACWRRSNAFLDALLQGYLDGDAHHDQANRRYRLGFTRNDALASDLRTIGARLGIAVVLKPGHAMLNGRRFPIYRGEVRFSRSGHHNERPLAEIVAIRKSRARHFYHVGVADHPHTFVLASGVLTCNSKPNPMPESVTDRPTKAHEYVFLLTKAERYYYDAAAVREPLADERQGRDYGGDHHRDVVSTLPEVPPGAAPHTGLRRGAERNRGGRTDGFTKPNDIDPSANGGRNRRTVWTITTQPLPEAHFAVMPERLVEPCILAGSRPGSLVLDPFAGSGTVGVVAARFGRSFVGLELNPAYCDMARRRLTEASAQGLLPLDEASA